MDEVLLQAAAGSRDIPRAAAGGTTVAIDVGQRLMRRTAPVDGMFQQFAIHTTGVGERSIAEPGRTKHWSSADGTLSFYGKDMDFDPAWFIYPFSFERRNYLLIEGNRTAAAKYLVAELLPGTGIVTRCYLRGPKEIQPVDRR